MHGELIQEVYAMEVNYRLDQSPLAKPQENKFVEAEASSRAALRVQPCDPEALFALGEAQFNRGDDAEAIRLFEQAIYSKPDFFRAYSRLADIYRQKECFRSVEDTYRRWSDVDPSNAGVRHLAAATSGRNVPARCDEKYIVGLFDRCANSFDDHLMTHLKYRGPEIVAAALSVYMGAFPSQLRILDAGCGTGLCGAQIRSWCTRLVGVDLSKEMVANARKRKVYDELIESEICRFMESRPAQFDVVVSADVLIYFGVLEPVMHAVRHTLMPSGLFVATVEALPDENQGPYRLDVNGRYSHHRCYIGDVLSASGFHLLQINPETIRWEKNKKVSGYAFVARKC
jgi:predicted TPR repeat methyltransferase